MQEQREERKSTQEKGNEKKKKKQIPSHGNGPAQEHQHSQKRGGGSRRLNPRWERLTRVKWPPRGPRPASIARRVNIRRPSHPRARSARNYLSEPTGPRPTTKVARKTRTRHCAIHRRANHWSSLRRGAISLMEQAEPKPVRVSWRSSSGESGINGFRGRQEPRFDPT